MPWKNHVTLNGPDCPTCHRKYASLDDHLKACTPENVAVWIFIPEYECPGHYPWTAGPLSESYSSDCYLIPLDTYLRWRLVQEDWERMNEEMHQLTGKI